jgi:hypothetical protein
LEKKIPQHIINAIADLPHLKTGSAAHSNAVKLITKWAKDQENLREVIRKQIVEILIEMSYDDAYKNTELKKWVDAYIVAKRSGSSDNLISIYNTKAVQAAKKARLDRRGKKIFKQVMRS